MSKKFIENLPSNFLKPASNYEAIKVLGQGEFGIVELVKEKGTDKLFAKKTLFTNEGDEVGDGYYFSHEFFSLREMRYTGLPFVQLEGVGLRTKNSPAFFITEYLKGGSLDTLIENKYSDCSDVPTTKMILIYGIAFALQVLHQKDIVHRDLKPANILLDEYRKPYLADFGFARQIYNPDDKFTGNIGTSNYMAPELLENEYISPDKSIDVYSFAVLTLEIITCELRINGKVPTFAPNTILNGIRYDIPSEVPECFAEMVRECWSGEASSRWPMAEVVRRMNDGELALPGCDKEALGRYREELERALAASERDDDETAVVVEQTKDFKFISNE